MMRLINLRYSEYYSILQASFDLGRKVLEMLVQCVSFVENGLAVEGRYVETRRFPEDGGWREYFILQREGSGRVTGVAANEAHLFVRIVPETKNATEQLTPVA